MAQTYTLGAVGQAFASGGHMLSIFNGAGSGRVVRVFRVWMLNNQTVAVTGVLTTMALRRTSAQSGGTAIVATKHDTASENIPAQILQARGAVPPVTGDVEYRRFMWSNDEPSASTGTSDEFECLVPLNCVWDSTGDNDVEPITLREGQGLTLVQIGTSAVGVADVFFEYTLAAT